MTAEVIALQGLDAQVADLQREIDQLKTTVANLANGDHETTDITAHLQRKLERMERMLRAREAMTVP